MSDDNSEQLDGDVLGEEPGDDERPGTTGFPPDRPLGAEDPSLVVEDDLDTRARARRSLGDAPVDDQIVLVDVAPEGALDHEAALLAEEAGAVDADDLAAEEAAMHLVDRDPVD